MATESFNASNVQSRMTTINGNFDNIGTELASANEKVAQGLSSPDEAMYGDGASKILATWDENSSSLQDFMNIFQDWSGMVVAMGNKYAELENGTFKVSDEDGYAALGETAKANRTTALKTEKGIKGFTTAQTNWKNKTTEDQYGIKTNVELTLENGKITQKETYDDLDGYYKQLEYDPEQKKYVYKYYKDGTEITEDDFNAALATKEDYADKMAEARIDDIYVLKKRIEDKSKNINSASDAAELQAMKDELARLESGDDLPDSVKTKYEEKRAALGTKAEEGKESEEAIGNDGELHAEIVTSDGNHGTFTLDNNGTKYSYELDANGNVIAYDDRGFRITDERILAAIGAAVAAGGVSGNGNNNTGTNPATTSSTINYGDSTYSVSRDKSGAITGIYDDKGNPITNQDVIINMASQQGEGTVIKIGNSVYTTGKDGQVTVKSTTYSGPEGTTQSTVTYDKDGNPTSTTTEFNDGKTKSITTKDSDGKVIKIETTTHNDKGEEVTVTEKSDGTKTTTTTRNDGIVVSKTEYPEGNTTRSKTIKTYKNGTTEQIVEYTDDNDIQRVTVKQNKDGETTYRKVEREDSIIETEYEYEGDKRVVYKTVSDTKLNDDKSKNYVRTKKEDGVTTVVARRGQVKTANGETKTIEYEVKSDGSIDFKDSGSVDSYLKTTGLQDVDDPNVINSIMDATNDGKNVHYVKSNDDIQDIVEAGIRDGDLIVLTKDNNVEYDFIYNAGGEIKVSEGSATTLVYHKGNEQKPAYFEDQTSYSGEDSNRYYYSDTLTNDCSTGHSVNTGDSNQATYADLVQYREDNNEALAGSDYNGDETQQTSPILVNHKTAEGREMTHYSENRYYEPYGDTEGTYSVTWTDQDDALSIEGQEQQASDTPPLTEIRVERDDGTGGYNLTWDSSFNAYCAETSDGAYVVYDPETKQLYYQP